MIDTARTDGYTFYLYEAIISRHDPAVFFGTELVVCEGDSQRLTDCRYLWSQNMYYYTNVSGTPLDTTVVVNEQDGVLTVERVSDIAIGGTTVDTVLYEYHLTGARR